MSGIVDQSIPDLTICNREPITRLDRTQSFGFLIALSNDWTVARASENTAEMLGTAAEQLIGRRLDTLISRQALHDIRNRMSILQATSSERLFDVGLITAKNRRIGEAVRIAIIEVILRYSEAASDERRRATERSTLLIAELNHRVRNILTLVRGLIARTGQSATGVAQYTSSLNGRVQALARAHDYVTRNSWGPASLLALLDDEVNAHRRNGHDVIQIDGPPVHLHPTAISTMALVIHELATNSAKYGALSTEGMVHVALGIRADGGLDIRWRERGGPPVQAPTRRGFGSVVIERTVPFDLQGTAEIRYALSGLEADFHLPAKHVVAVDRDVAIGCDAVASEEAVVGAGSTEINRLASTSILLLEDSMIIALETEDMLYALGANRVTTASTIAEADALLAAGQFDLAVLDINVAGQVSFDFAQRVKKAGVPYIFASGYGDQVALDGEETGTIVLQKPFKLEHLRQALLMSLATRLA